MRQIKRLVFHHSASSLDTRVDQIRTWHKQKGWQDIGYHYVIPRFGQIEIGRPIHIIGAHAKGANEDSIGICLIGNNLDENERWTTDQKLAAKRLIQAWRTILPALPIFGHREVGTTATECPGVDVREAFGIG